MEIIAHIRDENGVTVTQSLATHLRNVADLMARAAEPYGLSAAARVIGLLHDVGKASAEFQRYIRHSYSHPEDRSLRGSVVHSTTGAQMLWQIWDEERWYEEPQHCFDGDPQHTFEFMEMAIFSHHSGLMNFLRADGNYDFLDRLAKEESDYVAKTEYFYRDVMPRAELIELCQQANSELENVLDITMDISPANNFVFYEGMLEKYLLSLLVDADRLDTAEFMSGQSLAADTNAQALWPVFAGRLEERLASFPRPENVGAARIYDSRQKISDACREFAAQPPGVYQLTVPTGSGKTLASLRFALHHAQKYQKNRIIYVIPYTSIIDQNAQVIRDIVGDSAVLEFHSGVMEAEEGPGRETDMPLARVVSERWDVPIVLTTQVQLLNTLFSGSNTALRRMQALADSIIIFDEIQTLPLKCTYLFNGALNSLTRILGTTAVLCTATQPQLGESLLEEPIILGRPADMVDATGLQDAFSRVEFSMVASTVHDGLATDCITARDIAAQMLADVHAARSVLGIVNTTGEARAIYEQLKDLAATALDDVRLIHLSTKLCPVHRKALLRDINATLAAIKAGASQRLIVISTQLIEAGVDVSFSVVYRALAGLASIAQAAGRCNRHGEQARGAVKLFELAEENLKRLPDIARGKRLTKDILARTAVADILAPATLDEFFRRYYSEAKEELPYRTKNRKDTLFNILSNNEVAQDNAIDPYAVMCKQGFADAAREFCVIDSKTTGVVVPYGEGSTIIDELGRDFIAPPELKRLLKRAQQYTVNIFDYEVQRLKDLGGIWATEQGIVALSPTYYSEELGVLSTVQISDFCLI